MQCTRRERNTIVRHAALCEQTVPGASFPPGSVSFPCFQVFIERHACVCYYARRHSVASGASRGTPSRTPGFHWLRGRVFGRGHFRHHAHKNGKLHPRLSHIVLPPSSNRRCVCSGVSAERVAANRVHACPYAANMSVVLYMRRFRRRLHSLPMTDGQ